MPEWTREELREHMWELNDRLDRATTQLVRIQRRRNMALREMIPYTTEDLTHDLNAVLRALQGQREPSLDDAPEVAP